MDLRQLSYLVALAEECHFTRAAAREHIAQPALSQQIRRLEEEVGVTLVERTTRQVTITHAGQVLVARARRILGEIGRGVRRARGAQGMESGRVGVGTMHTMGPIDVSLPLAIFHERHPGIELTVRSHSSEELAQMLRDDTLDLAFLSVTERVESHGLGLHQLMSEELVAVVPLDHRFAGRRKLADGDLEGEEFISYREGARLRERLIGAGAHAGFQPTIRLESNESGRIRRLVARGMGSRSSPASDAVAPGAEVAVVALVGPEALEGHHAGLAPGSAASTPGGDGVPGARTEHVLRAGPHARIAARMIRWIPTIRQSAVAILFPWTPRKSIARLTIRSVRSGATIRPTHGISASVEHDQVERDHERRVDRDRVGARPRCPSARQGRSHPEG